MNWPESTTLWQDILFFLKSGTFKIQRIFFFTVMNGPDYSQQNTQQETSWLMGSHHEESNCWCIKTVDGD